MIIKIIRIKLFYERGRAGVGRGRARERILSRLPAQREPGVGLDLMTLRS